MELTLPLAGTVIYYEDPFGPATPLEDGKVVRES